MRNLTFKSAMWKGSRPTVNRQSTDGQSQRHCKQTPLSKRWKVLMTLVFLFTLGIGQMWAEDPTYVLLESIDFTNTTNFPAATYNSSTANVKEMVNGVCVFVNKSKTVKINNTTAGVVFEDDNMQSDGRNSVGIPVTGVNGTIKVQIVHNENNSSAKHKYGIAHSTNNNPTGTLTWDVAPTNSNATQEKNVCSFTKTGLTGSSYTVWVGRGSSSYKTVKRVEIYTVAPEGYSVTYVENGHGATQTDLTGQTKLPATLPTLSEAGWNFGGWFTDNGTFKTPAEPGATLTANATLYAKWTEDSSVEKFSVTYDLNGPTGSAPTEADKAAGASFNLAAAPSWAGHAFDGWLCNIDNKTKTAGSSYTMTAAPTTFTAQWKAVPQTIYSLTVTNSSNVNLANGGTQNDLADDATIVGGGAYMQNDHASKEQQILASTKLQFKAGTVTLAMTLNTALKEGDTIKATGLNSEGLCFGVTFNRADNLDNQLASDASYFVVPEEFEGKTTLYAWRHSGSGTTCASIIIRRPADRPISSTEISLSDLKVNNRSISADSLAALVADHSLTLGDEFAVAPVIKFNQHKVITYSDGESPAYIEKDKVYTVTATTVSSNWQAAQEINSITYTVTAPKISSAKVYYYNGSSKLGEEVVAIDGSPVNYATYQGKVNLAEFVDWYTNADLAEEHKIADISALVVTENVNVYGKWNYQYATSVNIEQWTLDNGKGVSDAQKETQTGALVSLLGTHKFASNIAYDKGNIELDSLNDDPGKTNRNYAYLGLKVKKSGKMLDFRLAKDSYVKVKFGNVAATPKVSINGADYADMELTAGVYSYTATGNDYVSIKTASDGAVVFQQVMINEDIAAVTLPWRVTYDANGGTCATEEAIWKGSALILPDVTPADADHTFAGWYDEVSGGSLQGVAGASYSATDNITLHAQFAPVEYSVTYVGGEGATGSMGPEAKGWGLEYTALANTFEKSGHVFSGWTVTGVDGVSTIPALGSFTMPKNPVTLTAIWTDNSKVAVIVETNVKYESLADAITAAEAGQTIQLLQNIEQANGVAIAKNLTLDLNGKTFTCTSGSNVNSRAIMITAGNVTIQNGSIIAVPTANFEGGAYGPIRIEGASTNVTLEDLTLRNGRHYGLGIKLVEGYLRMENCTVISENGGGGLEVGEATADVINCTFTQTGLDNAHAWISTCLATCDNGVLNVQGGTYTSEHYSMYVYTSGGTMDVTNGNFTGDIVNQVTPASYPDAVGTVNISGGSFEGAGGNPIQFTTDATGKTSIAISGGTFDAPVANEYCAYGYIPSAEVASGVYTVVPKDGVEIIGVVTTGGTNKTVTGLYKGDASVNLDNNKKIGEGNKYIYVTLKEGYTFEENDVLIVDVDEKSDLTSEKALEITTGVGNIDGAVWKTLVDAEYDTGENSISLEGIAAGQTSIGLKRSAKQNAKINGLRVLRPMNPILTAITINGEACDKGEGNVFSVTLPNGTILGSLTVVPTIVKNGEGGSAAPTAAWAWGDNTYRVTDKDGDYTDYTITLTEAAAPSAAPVITAQPEGADYIEGASIAALEVGATGSGELSYQWYLGAEAIEGATAASYAPAVSAVGSYVYHCVVTNTEEGHPATSLASDNATITISEDPNAIKLINKSTGSINTTNFITGVTATEVNSEKAAAWGNTQGTFAGINNLTKLVQYNATTTKTKVSVKLYSTNNNAKEVYLHKILEGSTTDVVETIPVSSNTPVEAEYTFDNAKNRSIYLATNSTDVKILQVKVVESGEALPMFGQAGYSLNLNKGRIASAKDVDMTFEGMAYKISSAYGVINSTEFKVKSADGNPYKMTFTVNTPVLMTITESGSNYYVYKVAEPQDKGDANVAGTKEYNLTAGTWVIESATTSEAKFTNIAFALPKCEQPTITTQPATKLTFDPGDMTATVVAAEPTDGGTLSYQWFNASDDSEVLGATGATLTTTTEGTYYVVVTNTLAGHQDVSVTSEEAELGYRVTDDATLKSLKYGTTAIALEDGVYNYNVELAKGTTDVPALSATATMDGYADVDINDAAEFVNYEASSTVTVKSEDETETLVYTVNFYVKHDLPQVDVTGTTTWDWTNAATTMQTIKPATKNVEQLMANIDDNGKKMKNDAEFNSQALIFSGQEALVGNSTRWYAKGGHIKFNVTVPGIVKVEFSDNGGNNRRLKINNYVSTESSASETDVKTYAAYVEAGEVTLMGVKNDSTGTDQYIRISKIEFKAEDNYHRTVNPNNIGTLCWTNDAILANATLYELAGKNEYNKLVFDEVPENRLVAGKPYIFVPENGNSLIRVFNTSDETRTSPIQNESGMQGTFVNLSSADGTTLWGNYIISNNHYIYVDYTNVNVGAYRAYILGLDDLNIVPDEPQQDPNGAPRRRLTIGDGNAPAVTTGVEGLHIGDQPVKVMIDGQIFILRGEKMYDATGRLVK